MLYLETEISVDFLKKEFLPLSKLLIYSLFVRILSLCFYIIDQNNRRRVQRVESAILRINLYLLDNAICCWLVTYPVDGANHLASVVQKGEQWIPLSAG